MKKTTRGSKKREKIVPKVTVIFENEPNYKLMAKAYIDFHHKTKHYLGMEEKGDLLKDIH